MKPLGVMELLSPTKNKVFDFVSKTYAMVDDPSTDSAISWSQDGKSFVIRNPAECCRDVFPRVLGIKDFARFERFGFRKIESGPHLEFARDDFERGKRELLEKIGERYVEKLRAIHELNVKPLHDRLRDCKNKKERELVFKESYEKIEMQRREMVDKYFAEELDYLMERIVSGRKAREEAESSNRKTWEMVKSRRISKFV